MSARGAVALACDLTSDVSEFLLRQVTLSLQIRQPQQQLLIARGTILTTQKPRPNPKNEPDRNRCETQKTDPVVNGPFHQSGEQIARSLRHASSLDSRICLPRDGRVQVRGRTGRSSLSRPACAAARGCRRLTQSAAPSVETEDSGRNPRKGSHGWPGVRITGGWSRDRPVAPAAFESKFRAAAAGDRRGIRCCSDASRSPRRSLSSRRIASSPKHRPLPFMLRPRLAPQLAICGRL